ncbi:MAG: hypothetical protein ACO1G9_13560 [Bacteroidota bacterium]
MSNQIQYKGNTGLAKVTIGNSNLDGSGDLQNVLTASLNGTFLKSIIIKAIGKETTEGMIRFFIRRGDVSFLISEVVVPIVTSSANDITFSAVLNVNYDMEKDDILFASTQNSEPFNIIALGLDWEYGTTTEQPLTAYTAIAGAGKVSVANSNKDGMGALVEIFTAGESAGSKGSEISAITIKALGPTTPGMIRLYITNNSENFYLFSEIEIPYFSQNARNKAFSHEVIFQGSIFLKNDYKIYASTQVAEPFNVIIEAVDWSYPS